jgi:hypothetical protein
MVYERKLTRSTKTLGTDVDILSRMWHPDRHEIRVNIALN